MNGRIYIPIFFHKFHQCCGAKNFIISNKKLFFYICNAGIGSWSLGEKQIECDSQHGLSFLTA
ncbi:hypothetical protein CD932_25495 [Janthinobacterium sp. PC23-8]|nr:hypothetical protein CD932_25495 [Janthinobacterium sp. PC23-8]